MPEETKAVPKPAKPDVKPANSAPNRATAIVEGLKGSNAALRSRDALVDAGVARAEAGQHLVADGAEMFGEHVDGDAVADQRCEIAAARWLRQVGHVDRHQIHRDAPGDRAALLVDDDFGAAHAVDAAGGAE